MRRDEIQLAFDRLNQKQGDAYTKDGDFPLTAALNLQSLTTLLRNIMPQSTAPSGPTPGDMYLDDGTNTASGFVGWRYYNGAAWVDVGARAPGAGVSDHGGLTGLGDDDHAQYVLHTEVDDTPVDGVTTDPVSSNWAYDHAAAADPHTGYRLESADHSHQSAGAQAGQVDHGLALTGLTDDDHPQYATVATRPWTTVLKTADESVTSTTAVQNDDHLFINTVANTNYVIRLVAFFATPAAADFRYRMVHSGTTTRIWRMVTRYAAGAISADWPTVAHVLTFDAADVDLLGGAGSGAIMETMILQVGASGGVLNFQWAQVTSNASATYVAEGSYLEYAVT